jgi:ribosomal protein S18 acetylase RimI-like enzyme
MKDPLLDNPIWQALISGNKLMAEGAENVKYFPADIAPFAGLKDFDQDSFKLLFDLIPKERELVMITAANIEIPPFWNISRKMTLFQMIFNHPKKQTEVNEKIVPLKKRHVPEMLDLTKLTNPGPFSRRTIEFGNYTGIFSGRNLVAMAGQRLHPDPYVEISAVCTYPDHAGKGYGTALIQKHVHDVLNAGNIPFLHVRESNEPAIKLYKSLGFEIRCAMNLNTIQK